MKNPDRPGASEWDDAVHAGMTLFACLVTLVLGVVFLIAVGLWWTPSPEAFSSDRPWVFVIGLAFSMAGGCLSFVTFGPFRRALARWREIAGRT